MQATDGAKVHESRKVLMGPLETIRSVCSAWELMQSTNGVKVQMGPLEILSEDSTPARTAGRSSAEVNPK